MAGESSDWKTMGKGAAKALMPAYVDAAMGTLANSESLTPEDYRKMREDKATSRALEFGNENKLEEMQQNPEVKPNMSARKEELRRILSGY